MSVGVQGPGTCIQTDKKNYAQKKTNPRNINILNI